MVDKWKKNCTNKNDTVTADIQRQIILHSKHAYKVNTVSL